MTTQFMGEDFLLSTKAAKRLYNEFARDLPIFDYHCHLPVKDIAENRRFADLTEAWLAGDHYKWRAMRANGVAERFITGDATSWEKFSAWASTVPATLRNPLYHWTHLELKRYFGVKGRLLGPETARGIFDLCSAKLRSDGMRAREILSLSNVRVVCTTDDPTDTLEHHKKLREDLSFPVTVIPAWRPDNAMAVDDPEAFNGWTDRLVQASGVEVKNWATFLEALRSRHEFFHEHGCRLSDHGLEEP
jgi:glucuronate isomerase